MLSGKYIYAVNSSGTEEKYPLWTDTGSSTGTHFLAYKNSESSTVSNSVWLSIRWNSSTGSYSNVSSVTIEVHLLNACKYVAKIESPSSQYAIYVGSGLIRATYTFPNDWYLFTTGNSWTITVNGTSTTIPTGYITRRIYNTSTENTTTISSGGYYRFSYTDNGIRFARLVSSGLSLKAYRGADYYIDNTTTFQCALNSNSCPTQMSYSCSSYNCTGTYTCQTGYSCDTTAYTCTYCYTFSCGSSFNCEGHGCGSGYECYSCSGYTCTGDGCGSYGCTSGHGCGNSFNCTSDYRCYTCTSNTCGTPFTCNASHSCPSYGCSGKGCSYACDSYSCGSYSSCTTFICNSGYACSSVSCPKYTCNSGFSCVSKNTCTSYACLTDSCQITYSCQGSGYSCYQSFMCSSSSFSCTHYRG